MARPAHFDIAADNPERAMGFYQKAFGWKFEKWEGPVEYWLITTGSDEEPGINGGLARAGEESFPGTVNSLVVESLDESIRKVEEGGGGSWPPGWPCRAWAGWPTSPIRPGTCSG